MFAFTIELYRIELFFSNPHEEERIMKYNHAVKVSCLTGLITLSLTAFSFAAAPADDSSKRRIRPSACRPWPIPFPMKS